MTATEIMAKWPSRSALADDVGKPLSIIHSWVKRDSIPPGFDVVLVEAAAARGFELSFRQLAEARAGRKADLPEEAA
ncbi:MAG: hypothetical protein AAF674_16840 [Pseudomonadota bacterium]